MDIEFGLKARHLANLNKWSALREFCLDKLESDPDEDFALYYLALSYQAQGDLEKAKEIVEPIYSNSSDFKSLYADICLQMKSFKIAESIYTELLANNAEDEFNIAKLAKAKLGLLKYKEAHELAQRCLAINPNNAEAIRVYFLVSDILDLDHSDFTESLLTTNPHNPTLIINYVRNLIKNNKPKEALDLAINALATHPNNELIRDVVKEAILANNATMKLLKRIFRFEVIALILVVYMISFVIKNKGVNEFIQVSSIHLVASALAIKMFAHPIGTLLVYFDDLGKKVQSKLERKCVPFLGLLFTGGFSLLIYSMINADTLILKFGFLFLFLTIPVSLISNTDGKLLRNSAIVLVLIVTALLASIFKNNLYLNILFAAMLLGYAFIIAFLFYVEVVWDKTKADNELV